MPKLWSSRLARKERQSTSSTRNCALTKPANDVEHDHMVRLTAPVPTRPKLSTSTYLADREEDDPAAVPGADRFRLKLWAMMSFVKGSHR